MKLLSIIFTFLLSVQTYAQSNFQNFLQRLNSATTSTEKNAVIDSFLTFARTQGIPFIENNTANFIYRGNATGVNIASDFNGWSPTAHPMIKIDSTNFFYLSKSFEINARLDYKFVINGSNWILDPENPNQISGGFGPNSELAMPAYVQPWEIKYKSNIKHGKVIQKNIFSNNLNATYQIQIYLPPDYDSNSTGYPTVYFQDGAEYISLASAVNILDNLLDSNKIEPLIGVFVKPNNRNEEYAFSKRNQYRLFFVNELVPYIDSTYRTIKSASKRLIIGDSYGGNISALISYNHAEIFGNCGLHSAAFQPNNYEAYNLILQGHKKEIKFVSIWGSYESLFTNMRDFRDSCIKKGYEFIALEFPEGHSWGLWRATIDIILENIFPSQNTHNKEIEGKNYFKLFQNYPNPFNSSTNLSFILSKPTSIKIKLINILGQEIATLTDQRYEEGIHTISFDTNNYNLSSGILFFKLESKDHREVQKGIYLK